MTLECLGAPTHALSPADAFRAKAPKVVGDLMRDFGLQDFQAAGIVGNTGRECLGFTTLREIGQPAGRGGYGWQQWTGPRAKTFLNWCATHRLDWRSDEANYGYLRSELTGAYAYCVEHVKETHDLAAATTAFEHFYERAGVPAIADRVRWAEMALAAYRAPAKAA